MTYHRQNKGGRPRHGDQVKTSPLNLRTTPALRARIEESARLNGVSLSREVENRVVQSFLGDDLRVVVREEIAKSFAAHCAKPFTGSVDDVDF